MRGQLRRLRRFGHAACFGTCLYGLVARNDVVESSLADCPDSVGSVVWNHAAARELAARS